MSSAQSALTEDDVRKLQEKKEKLPASVELLTREQQLEEKLVELLDFTRGFTGEVWNINGHPYYTTQGFSRIVNIKPESVRQLMYRGNQVRRLKSLKIGKQLFIPCDELLNFHFTMPGGGFTTYKHTKDGEILVD